VWGLGSHIFELCRSLCFEKLQSTSCGTPNQVCCPLLSSSRSWEQVFAGKGLHQSEFSIMVSGRIYQSAAEASLSLATARQFSQLSFICLNSCKS
jgi:hypothetical protein